MRTRSIVTLLCLIATLFPAPGVFAVQETYQQFTFADPLDALSIQLTDDHPQAVSAWNGNDWTEWQELHVENEQDPALTESNLVMFPHAVSRIRVQSDEPALIENIHPIRVSSDPVHFSVATAGDVQRHILSRNDWGADPSLLIRSESSSSVSSDATMDKSDNGGTAAPSVREKDCNEVYAKYPDEFKSSTPVTENANGEKLRWPQQYSPQIKLLAVHHTALKVTGDARSGVERMRALYQYHAQNRGWGDIGYHYMIDEQGNIYEGRAGGEFVVGGHAYCNNVGTIGIAMMGNFDVEQPTQAQTHSLQWLLRLLAEKYHLDTGNTTMFHGKTLPVIVGHRQLVSTDCPGLAVWTALDQIRMNVRTGSIETNVKYMSFPTVSASSSSGGSDSSVGIVTGKDGLAALSETIVEGRPGGEVILPIFFRATTKSYSRNTRIARLTRSPGFGIWQERDGKFVPVRGDIKIPVPLVKQGESVMLRLKVRLPMTRGSETLKIGSIRYTFQLSGKTARGQLLNSMGGSTQLRENPAVMQSSRVTLTSSSSATSSSSISSTSSDSSPMIRIFLSTAGTTPQVSAGDPLMIDGKRSTTSLVRLKQNGSLCEAENGVKGTTIRISADGPVMVGGASTTRQYRGTIECRITDNQLVLINELPMEDYLAGLAEEPDTEPYEKQRAFAIAARTYATYYLNPSQRKFPGKPYDGSDSPATFQLYKGYDFESPNPNWLRAVRSTSQQVMTYRGSVIRPPYFSSDDGRTRTPAEAGWNNFPAAEIYTSKNDHWCTGMTLAGHGVGMSGCGAEGQAEEGKMGEQILQYYYPGTILEKKS